MATLPQSPFLWVHKGTQSQSLSKNDPGSSREIRSFVQNQRIAKLRQLGELQFIPRSYDDHAISPTKSLPAREKRGASDPGGVKAALLSSSDMTSDGTKGSHSPSTNVQRRESTAARRKKAPRQRRLLRRQSPPGVSELTTMQPIWRLEPTNFLEGSAIDPFNTTAQPITAEADTLLKYYASFLSSGYTPYKLQHLPGKLRAVTPIQSVLEDHMSSAMRFDHCLYALYAFASVRLFHVMKIRLKGIKSPPFYMAQAVAALRRRLEECQKSNAPIDRATISAIAQLALADWTSGDLVNAKVHISTLANLLGYIDVDDVRGRFIIETTRTADFQVALEDGSLPLLSAVSSFEPLSEERIMWLKGQVKQATEEEKAKPNDLPSRLGQEPTQPSEILDDLQLTLDYRMGWALEDILETDIIEPGLNPVVRSMLDVTTIGKAVWRLGVASVADARYMCRWGRAQLHCLHTYGFDHCEDNPTLQMLLTNCVRLALLVVGTLCTNRLSKRTTRRIGFEQFEACRHIDLNLQMPRLAWLAYLWALVTAATVAEHDSEVRQWLVSRAADTAIQLGLTSYEELDEAMIGFLYSWTFSIQVMREIPELVSTRLPASREVHDC